MTKSEYIDLAKLIEGEVISSVEYIEIDYPEHNVMYNDLSDYDCLDFGINLYMKSGKVFGLIWGSEFTSYGVSILPVTIQSEKRECRILNVTNALNWQKFIGKEIKSVEVIWSWVKDVGIFKKKTYYPQSIVINFSAKVGLVVSAFEIYKSSHFGMSDNITVFFSEASAKNFDALF